MMRERRRMPSAGTKALMAGGVGLAALYGWSMWRRHHRYDFAGKTVLITGGSRGLGLVMARQLLTEGARVCICARDSDELDRAEDELRARGWNVLTFVCNVADAADVAEMVNAIEYQWGPIDVLINNAGVIRVGPVETMTGEDYEYMLDVHLRGPLNTVNAVMPSMRLRREGRIVNISSIGGLLAFPHLLPYCASKFALVGLSQGLRIELRKYGIIVTTVCPGLTRTGSQVQAEFKGRHRQEYTWFSIGSSLPGTTASAERAASQVIDACRYGKARVTLTLQAKAAALANTVAPGPFSWMLELVNRLLPSPGGIQSDSAKGIDSHSRWSPSLLTTLGDRAARRNNEFGEHRHNGSRGGARS